MECHGDYGVAVVCRIEGDGLCVGPSEHYVVPLIRQFVVTNSLFNRYTVNNYRHQHRIFGLAAVLYIYREEDNVVECKVVALWVSVLVQNRDCGRSVASAVPIIVELHPLVTRGIKDRSELYPVYHKL